MRFCSGCKHDKPSAEFYANRSTTRCKSCIQEQNREWYQNNRGRKAQAGRLWRERNPERWKELRKRHRDKPETKAQEQLAGYMRMYGLSAEDAAWWLTTKPEQCQLCDRTIQLELDHDHRSGRVRGWLCHTCNVGLGSFRDQPDLLEKAAKYLRSHS